MKQIKSRSILKNTAYIIIGTCIFLLLVSGCNKEQSVIKTSEFTFISSAGAGNGNDYYLRVGQRNKIIAAYDSVLHKMEPLCTKTDCDHKSDQEHCMAHIISKESGGAFGILGKNIVYTTKKETEYRLIKRDMTGNNRQELAGWHGGLPNLPAIATNKWFIQVESEWKLDEFGEISAYECGIRIIDLDNNTNDFIEIINTKNLSAYRLIGVYKDDIYYIFCDYSKAEPQYFLYRLNLQDHTKKQILLLSDNIGIVKMNKEYIVYSGTKDGKHFLAYYNLTNGNGEYLFWNHKGQTYPPNFIVKENIIVFHEDNSGWYQIDLITKETQLIRDEKEIMFGIIADVGDGYLVEFSDFERNDYGEFGFISYKDFSDLKAPTYLTSEQELAME